MPGSDAFPFVLTTSKMGYFCQSQHRQISSLRKREPYPSVELSPSAAEGQGVGPGDWVRIETAHGATRMKVKINKALHDRVVRASYGWWQGNSNLGLPDYDAFDASGANYNLMIGSDRLDPVSGVPALRSGSCRIVPVSSMHNK
jgi:anaerobic selenocysteine-containing dehydrogenase